MDGSQTELERRMIKMAGEDVIILEINKEEYTTLCGLLKLRDPVGYPLGSQPPLGVARIISALVHARETIQGLRGERQQEIDLFMRMDAYRSYLLAENDRMVIELKKEHAKTLQIYKTMACELRERIKQQENDGDLDLIQIAKLQQQIGRGLSRSNSVLLTE